MLRFDPSKVTPGTLAQALGIVADLVNRGADWKGVAELPPQEVLDLFTEVEEPGVYRRELTAETVIRNTRPDGTLFRRNLPLTRAAIDAARAEDGGQG